MSGFIDWLETRNAQDTKVRAILRRSLAFDPGQYVQAFPYVEPFVKNEGDSWRRDMHYLVASLWAAHWREGRIGTPIPIGKACAYFDNEKRKKMSSDERKKTTSTERRFVTLLDADSDQLPHRLRQMVALLKEHDIDFDALLNDLLGWNDDQKSKQTAWARDFYRTLNEDTYNTPSTETETAE